MSQLITIGGDDTAYSAMQLERVGAGRLRVVHVPKTIDNDLDLPSHVETFGFQTARHHGVEIVKNLMVDAKTTSRWYFLVTMGRKAGPPRARHRQGGWRHADADSGSVPAGAGAVEDRRRQRWPGR